MQETHTENTHNKKEMSNVKMYYLISGIVAFSILVIYPIVMTLAVILQIKMQG